MKPIDIVDLEAGLDEDQIPTVQQALKLQELVKEIKPTTFDTIIQSLEIILDYDTALQVRKLQSLIEESEK